MEQYFKILGIEPTKDENQIKKAYRTLLKQVHPEEDQEGFRRLREAYEQACVYSRRAEDENAGAAGDGLTGISSGSGIDGFIRKCEELYASFSRRVRETEWKKLFEEADQFDLEEEEALRYHFFAFLLDHYHLPFPVWQEVDRVFRITGCREELMEHFPENYVDYLQQAVRYEGSLNYDLFSCYELENVPGDIIDRYIDDYHRLRQFTDLHMESAAKEVLTIIESCPVRHPYSDLEKARILLMDNQQAAAGEILTRLAGDYGSDERIACCHAQFLGICGQWDKAEAAYDRLLDLWPDSFSIREGKAEALLHLGYYREARDRILDLLETSPQDDRLMNDLNEANESLIADLNSKEDLSQDDLMDLSWCYYQNMMLTEALSLLDSFRPDEDHEPDYHNLKGRVYLTLERDREALEHLVPWLASIRKLKPDGTRKTEKRLARLGYAYYTIGAAKAGIILAEKEGDLSEAMSYFEMAVKEEKDPVQAVSYQHTMADIWRQAGNPKQVLKVCEAILARDPQYYPAVVLRQEAFLMLGMYQQCADDFNRAVNLYPYNGKPYAILMRMYFLFGDYDKAGDVLKDAEQVMRQTVGRESEGKKTADIVSVVSETRDIPSDDLAVMKARLIAVTATSRRDLENALRILEERKEKGWDYRSDLDQTEWQEINFRRGLILSDLGRQEEAKAAFEEALTRRDDSGIFYSYATVLMKCGEYGKAIGYLERTLALLPQDVAVLFRLGLCYKETGDRIRALSFLNHVLELQPDHPLAGGVITEIQKIL